MKTLLVYAHPNPASFNHAIVTAAQEALQAKGHEVRVRDLYALKFNPLLGGEDFTANKAGTPLPDVAEEQKHITWADAVVFVYPMWWGDRPAMLKGYIDRIFTGGFAYKYGANGAEGLLGPRRAMVFQTVGGPEMWYTPENLNALNKPMAEWTMAFCGMKDNRVKTFFAVPSAGDTARHAMLDDVKTSVIDFVKAE